MDVKKYVEGKHCRVTCARKSRDQGLLRTTQNSSVRFLAVNTIGRQGIGKSSYSTDGIPKTSGVDLLTEMVGAEIDFEITHLVK